jgi:PHD/YefM family antitoxin component YafN of YafNO toxin-antitoxin module
MNIDENIHRKLKVYVTNRGISMKEYILDLIKSNIEEDETEYLLSTEANRNALKKAMDDVKNGKFVEYKKPKILKKIKH